MNFKGFHYSSGRLASDYEVKLIQDMYDAVTLANAWDFVKKDPGDDGFLFCKDPMMNAIRSHMKMLHDHSVASFASMMRVMQQIAMIGEDNFRKLFFSE